MPLLKDARAARRVLGNIVRSRASRAELARRLPGVQRPAAGSIQVVVYFADSRVNMYQIRQWYAPLAELAKRWPVAVIARSPGTMLTLLDESPVPAVYLRQVVDLERFIHDQDIKIVFYVNQNTKNFQMFRYGRMWHVFINHGESDKMYMTTNQFKAYDYSLVAGDAARERLTRKLWDFDVDKRTLSIGRPQADHFAGALPYPADDRTVVLYAPTWEGDRASAAYGSIASHGVPLVRALLATGTHRVLYRPHPRSGVVDPQYGAANRQIIADIAAANAADPAAHHIFDDGNELGWQLAGADVAITDVSAMVYDRLAVGKPLIVTRPVSAAADVDESGYLGDCEWLSSDEAGDIVSVADRVQNSAEARERLGHWVTRHFGDTTPGAATERFHGAVEQLVAEWERNAELHAGDPDDTDEAAFADDFDEDAVDSD
jgi:hypothetical protein